MSAKKTLKSEQRAKCQCKSPATQAGEFVRKEIERIREDKYCVAKKASYARKLSAA